MLAIPSTISLSALPEALVADIQATAARQGSDVTATRRFRDLVWFILEDNRGGVFVHASVDGSTAFHPSWSDFGRIAEAAASGIELNKSVLDLVLSKVFDSRFSADEAREFDSGEYTFDLGMWRGDSEVEQRTITINEQFVVSMTPSKRVPKRRPMRL